MFFIGQNLKHVRMTYSFLELLIFFCLTLDIIWVYFSPHQRNIARECKLHGGVRKIASEENFLPALIGKPIMKYLSWTCFWYWCWKKPFFWCKIKTRYEKNLIFQFHENTFRNSSSQMFFKIGALKNFHRKFSILRIKMRLQQSSFPVRSSHAMLIYW